jgi:hypothetical protein
MTEEILRNLFMVRKNMPDNFPDILNFTLAHPQLNFLDKNNIFQGMKMFDIDIEALNAVKVIAQKAMTIEVAELRSTGSSAARTH